MACATPQIDLIHTRRRTDEITVIAATDARDKLNGVSRSSTHPPCVTPESNRVILDALAPQQVEHAKALQEIRDLLIELAGRSGNNGRIGRLIEQLEHSRTSQGRRVGELEKDVSKLKQTRAQLAVVAAIAMVLLGVLLKVLFG